MIRKYNRKYLAALCLVSMLSFNCKNVSDVVRKGDVVSANSVMIRILDSLVHKSQPLSNPFDNKANAQYLNELIQSNPGDLNKQLVYVKELLFAGETASALKRLEELSAMIKYDPEVDLYLKKWKAIAWLRLAEQKNCQENHSPESCLLPLSGTGIHQDKNGSEKALTILLEIVKQTPEDLVSVWLANICAMTLGRYPDALPASVRIDPGYFKNKVDFPRFENISGFNGTDVNQTSGAVAVEDYDNDGYYDIITCGYGIREKIKFLHNDGDGKFSDWTDRAGLKGMMGGLNIVQGDYDNDGRMDFMVLRAAWIKSLRLPVSLFRNMEDGTFRDVTIESGLYKLRSTQAALFADFDNDGWLDVFIGNESVGGDLPLELWRNNGKGGFVNVVQGSGLEYADLFVKGVACGDLDNDGRNDLYLSVMGGDNLLFINESGDGILKFRLAAEVPMHLPKESFPAWCMDFNNDGWLDIFCGSFAISRFNVFNEDLTLHARKKPFNSEISRLYLNRGELRFEDISREAGLNRPIFVMGSGKGDINNDGFEDIYLGTGEPALESLIPNLMFLNKNGQSLEDVSFVGGFAHLQKGHGIAFADFDRDGDQDIFAEMGGAFEGDGFFSAFFENPGFPQKQITVRLKGNNGNYFGAHSRVTAYLSHQGKSWQVHRQMDTGGSFGSSPYVIQIGMGDSSLLDSLVVRWHPSGKVQTCTGLTAGKNYRIEENQNLPEELDFKVILWNRSHQSNHTHH